MSFSIDDNSIKYSSLNPDAARWLTDTTKSVPMMDSITPRWLLTFLPWVATESGRYRVNKVKKGNKRGVQTSALNEHYIPSSYVAYEDNPKEYTLSIVQTNLCLNTRITDIFNVPINQKEEQIRLTIENLREQQEWEIVNNKDFGLINNVPSNMTIESRTGSPTPDDLDELLSLVWKKPAFFLAHPKTIAAFGRECTKRGVPPATVNIYGSPFITWRGVPLVPCDKMPTEKILLMRVGEKEQGVIGLHQPGIPGECHIPSLSIHFAGIDNMGVASYIMTLYFGVAILTDDAIGLLDNLDVGKYYDYE